MTTNLDIFLERKHLVEQYYGQEKDSLSIKEYEIHMIQLLEDYKEQKETSVVDTTLLNQWLKEQLAHKIIHDTKKGTTTW
jgi:hypothetical protein